MVPPITTTTTTVSGIPAVPSPVMSPVISSETIARLEKVSQLDILSLLNRFEKQEKLAEKMKV